MTLTFALTTMLTFAQSSSQPPIQNISTDSTVVYRLVATNNTYNFIKLNTRNGQMWQVQWSLKDNQFETTLSNISRVTKDEEKNGRQWKGNLELTNNKNAEHTTMYMCNGEQPA